MDVCSIVPIPSIPIQSFLSVASIQIYFEGAKFFPHRQEGDEARCPKGREQGWGPWEGGSEPHPHQLDRGVGERCKLPQRGRGGTPENLKFGAT